MENYQLGKRVWFFGIVILVLVIAGLIYAGVTNAAT